MQLPKTLSPSSICQFLTCPYQWYCNYQEYPEIVTNEDALLFGKAIHSVIENYYSKTEGDIVKNLDEALIESGSWITDKYKAKTKKFYNNFINHEKERIKRNEPKPKTELKLKAKLFSDYPDIVGRIDCYTKETATIVDWKTGSDASMSDDKLIQGKIYEMLLKNQGQPVSTVIFSFILQGVNPRLPQVSDAYIYAKIKNICDMIQADNFPSRYSPLCNWCGYQLRCRYKDKEGWLV